MKRKLLFIILNLSFGFGVIKLLSPQVKVDIRFALFSNYTQDINDFNYFPTDYKSGGLGFIHYKEKYIKAILESHAIMPFNFQDSMPFTQRAQNIALTYSKNGGSGCGKNSSDLIKNIRWLSEDNGHGCCSDHSQVFIALCLVNKIFSREVHHKSHTFNEYYDPSLHKWIWIDTQYCLMAQDDKGNFLSLKETYEILKDKQKVNWYFFGTPLHQLYNASDYQRITNYFTTEEFKILAMTLGNNVFEVDFYNKKYTWLPKEIKQFLLLSINKQPGYLFYDPENLITSKLKYIKVVSLLVLSSFIMINMWILFPSIRYRFRKKVLGKV